MKQRYEKTKTGEYSDVYYMRMWYTAIEISEISEKEIEKIFKSYKYNMRFLKLQRKIL